MRFQIVGSITSGETCHTPETLKVREEFEAAAVEEAILRAERVIENYTQKLKDCEHAEIKVVLRSFEDVWTKDLKLNPSSERHSLKKVPS